MTNAIFLYFQSIDDQEFGDDFYYKNPRERIFRFWNYENYEPPFFDADYPVSQTINKHGNIRVSYINDKTLILYTKNDQLWNNNFSFLL